MAPRYGPYMSPHVPILTFSPSEPWDGIAALVGTFQRWSRLVGWALLPQDWHPCVEVEPEHQAGLCEDTEQRPISKPRMGAWEKPSVPPAFQLGNSFRLWSARSKGTCMSTPAPWEHGQGVALRPGQHKHVVFGPCAGCGMDTGPKAKLPESLQSQ